MTAQRAPTWHQTLEVGLKNMFTSTFQYTTISSSQPKAFTFQPDHPSPLQVEWPTGKPENVPLGPFSFMHVLAPYSSLAVAPSWSSISFKIRTQWESLSISKTTSGMKPICSRGKEYGLRKRTEDEREENKAMKESKKCQSSVTILLHNLVVADGTNERYTNLLSPPW